MHGDEVVSYTKADLKSSVFNRVLKLASEVARRVCFERLFQVDGAAWMKARDAVASLKHGVWNNISSSDRRLRERILARRRSWR